MSHSTTAFPINHEASDANPLISVAICTYNRADRLALALDALLRQSLSAQYFEILVIDNASTDNTQHICYRYQTKLSNLRYIYEPVQGLSKARNTGLAQARCEFIAYLDDDAIPCENWLEFILKTFQTVKPTPVGVGGPIRPLWELERPEWMQAEMDFLFSILDDGDHPHWLKFPKFPFGANMSYRRDALRQIGGFDESLGRKGESLLSCEEYLLNKTLTKQGGKFYYTPQASVQHWIPKERTNFSWLIRRSYWQGRSEAVVDQMVGKSLKRQGWDSIWKFLNAKRLATLGSRENKIQVATKAWISRCWGYFFQVWFRHLISLETSYQLKKPTPTKAVVPVDRESLPINLKNPESLS